MAWERDCKGKKSTLSLRVPALPLPWRTRRSCDSSVREGSRWRRGRRAPSRLKSLRRSPTSLKKTLLSVAIDWGMRTRRKSSCCSRRQGAKRTASWASWRASWSAAESWASWRASWSAAERRSPPRRKSSVERKALVCSRRHTKKNALRVFLHTLSLVLTLATALARGPPPPSRPLAQERTRFYFFWSI